jgi:hypothetical protein
MMGLGVVFCKTICQFCVSWVPLDMQLTLFDSVFDPIKSHVHGTCEFFLIMALLYPLANVLSVFNGVGGCGCPISSNVVCKIFASFALRKTDHISASAADDIAYLRILMIIKTAPLVSLFWLAVLIPM